MIELKKVNLDDIENKWNFYKNIPKDENGFTNSHHNISKEDFIIILKEMIDHSNGINLPNKYVPYTEYYLYENSEIIGLFRLRHKINDFMTEINTGHIGYYIKPEKRKQGYATIGLKLLIDLSKNIIEEDFLQAGAFKSNIASIKTLEKCGFKTFKTTENKVLKRLIIKNAE